MRVVVLIYSCSLINPQYNSVRCSKRKASQHLNGTVNKPTRTSAQSDINLHLHFEMGVQGKQNTLKGTVELVRDKWNATRIVRICFHTRNNYINCFHPGKGKIEE